MTSKPLTHRSVLAIAIPIMLSNVTEPLIGVVNTTVIGQLPEAHYIGAVSASALIFAFLFWGFGFLRLSTGGLSAQAVGAGDNAELAAVFWRSLGLGLVIGLGLLLASPLIGKLAFTLIGGSPEIRSDGLSYFNYRIWSAPAALANFSILGWFVGQARAKYAFYTQVFLNLTNMAFSSYFVLVLHWNVAGVGLAAVIAEYAALALGLLFVLRRMKNLNVVFDAKRILDRPKLLSTLSSNTDIMIRTLCLLFAFAWFTARGARAGDLTIATNAVLLNFFEMSAYLIDGFSYAAESLVGQAVGAKNRQHFWQAIKLTTGWAMVLGVICSLIIGFAGPWCIDAMTVNPEVRALAREYLGWTVLAPILSVVCFQFDGIYTGAMATRDMRNMMGLSLAIYLVSWWFLETAFGNHGLWAALNIFFLARSISFASRLRPLERRAFQTA
ncbi:MAG: MATE family efflux transporter [Aestuariivirga sp.]